MLNKIKLTEIVAEEFGTTPNIIRGKSRTRRASYARDALAYVMHLHNCTHEEISRLVNRHRTSVTYGLKRVQARLESEARDCVVYCSALNKVCSLADVQIKYKTNEPIEED
jgi:chromosomal replication initiation ATPase DnaA